MFCGNCGRNMNQGEIFCAACGSKVANNTNTMNNNVVNNNMVNNNMNNNMVNNNGYSYQQMVSPNMPVKPKKSNGCLIAVIVVLVIIVLFIVGIVMLFSKVFTSLTEGSEKLVCESAEGNVTIMYTEDEVIGYTAVNIDYDLDEEKELANDMGIESYISEYSKWFKNNTSGTCTINGEEVGSSEEEVEEEIEEVVQTMTVGNDDYGYINVPKNWVKFYDVDGNDSIQYSYAGVYIISLNYIDANGYTAKDYASNYMTNKQNDSNVTNVTGATVKIGQNKEYTAYQVYMYYPSDSSYLVTYWFDTGDGKVRYMALEGPEKLNDIEIYDFLDIPESFSLNKSI